MTDFLYPTSRQYPFDEACEQIVRRLEALGWRAPGIEVMFYDYDDMPYRQVLSITGQDFLLRFIRVQGTLADNRNDIAAVSEIVIEKEALNIAAEPEIGRAHV